jgi:phenylacetate-CoA ligase
MRKFVEETYYHLPSVLRSAMVNFYGYFLSRNRFGWKYKKYFEFFKKTQWQSPEEIKQFQMAKLKEIMGIAYQKVPYYRKLFSEYGLTAGDFHTFDDLKKLPILTKEIIRCNFSNLLNEDIKNMDVIRSYSSGTTGQKLEFYIPKELAYNVNYSLLYRFYDWAGIKLRDKRITIGGRLFTKKAPYWVYNKAENQLLLSIHHLGNDTVDDYIEKIRKFSPVFIQGHPTGIFFISQRMVEKGTSIDVKAVFTTGETLDESQREVIKKAFNTEVFDSYGLSECVVTAFECERHNGFHEGSELGIMEFEKTNSCLYKVIGTSLWNYAMPFIRYEIEDLVELSPTEKCTCGRGLPLKIRKVSGRIDDVVFSPDENIILPVSVRMRIKPLLKSFENYQLQQLDKNNYALLIEGTLNETRRNKFLETLKEILGNSARIKIKEIDKIMTLGGKVRNIVNFHKH